MTQSDNRRALDATSPVQFLPGVGPVRAKQLEKLGIVIVLDLLWHVPRTYMDRSRITPFADFVPGGTYTSIGEIVSARSHKTFRRMAIFEVELVDGSGRRAAAVWFNQPFLAQTLKAGRQVLLHGKVVPQRGGRLQFQSPEYELLGDAAALAGQGSIAMPEETRRGGRGTQSATARGAGDRTAAGRTAADRTAADRTAADRTVAGRTAADPRSAPPRQKLGAVSGAAPLHGGRVVPLYPLTSGISQKQLRRWVQTALETVGDSLGDPIPSGLRARFRLGDLRASFERIHFPGTMEEAQEARDRLAFEEFFGLQIALGLVKRRRASESVAPELAGSGELDTKLRAGLPFALTDGQERVLKEIRGDLALGRPMSRLLQGDVGSGKTIVAALAAATAIESGAQVAFMAPTEILAIQQFESFTKWFQPLGHRVELLIGRTGAAERRRILTAAAAGTVDVVVGTHALQEGKVGFQRLGLVVVDEQHRFGVMQRARLVEKGEAPHCLVMSATPIPRTLSLTLYGDLDLSILSERPPGRMPPKSYIVPPRKREGLLEFVAGLLRDGERAFFVYPLVEESEQSDLKDATRMADEIGKHPAFQGIPVGLLHGRMKGEEKEDALNRFRDGTTPCLVSTTVVEVGVDVPQASVMVVEHPERFGLSQLHQLRGRVGRGGGESHFFMAVPSGLAPESYARLNVLVKESSGFRVAEEDLQLRGPGDLLGTAQHGLPTFRVADLVGDPETLTRAREAAEEVLGGDPDLEKAANRALREFVEARYGRGFQLFKIG
ncbi:MAG: ATP-dependent DNA helicase RecG [Candidatus Eisenbacteria bacterium]|nr:ATP-dependent DNA helicase RecG [Candidatus Eisenbacteria bacterium]